MNIDTAINLMSQMFMTTLFVGGPIILITFIVGLIISIFQAATQINEMTLTFIPKIVATVIGLIILGSWMFTKLVNYTKETLTVILSLIQ